MSDFDLSDDPARLDLDRVLALLGETYWWKGSITPALLARVVRGSLCVGAYRQGRQIGFARAITDRTTMAWLSDVVVAPEAQGQGLGRAMTRFLIEHPDMRGLRRWNLSTRDAHGVYAPLGFAPLADPGLYMERVDPSYAAAIARE